MVQRLLGESIGKASIKVAMFSKQRSIAPPAGKLFLLFKPWETKTRTVNNRTHAEMVPYTVFGSAEVNLLRPNTAYFSYDANESVVLGI